MRIGNNLSALTAFNALNRSNNAINKTIQQLSTGLRINSAADDAAGFAISEKMRSQISGLDRAIQNSQDGISLLQTAEGALEQTNSMLQRMRELSLQAINDTLTSQDRQYVQLEIDELKKQIDRIANTTQFNQKRILDGSSGALWASSSSGVKVRVNGGLTHIDQFGQKVSAEGNYKIDAVAEGRGQVQKSALMMTFKTDTSDADAITETVRSVVTRTITETEIRLEEVVTRTEEPYRIFIDGSSVDSTGVVDNFVDSANVENREAIEGVRAGWTFENGVLTITANGTYNIVSRDSTISTTNRIKVAEGLDDVNIFLTDVNIDVNNISQACPFEISSGSTVNVYLSGENTLKSGSPRAGLEVPDGATLTLSSAEGDGQESGRLEAVGKASGGYSGAGIGGHGGPGSGRSGRAGNITINGGTIVATGGDFAAGIGGGDTYGNDGGGHIVINGGNITAEGGMCAAGIGHGDNARGIEEYTIGDDSITINGGIVTAKGGESSAGIGGGRNVGSGVIRIRRGLIDNGSITAYPGYGCRNDIGDGAGASPAMNNVTETDDVPVLRTGVPSRIDIVENSTVREERQVQTTRQVKDFSESTRVVSDDRGENPIETLPLNPPTESVKAKGLPEGSYVVDTTETSLTSPTFQLTGSYGTDPSSLITLSPGTGTLQNNANVLFEVTAVDRSAGTVTLNATANIMGTDGETTRHVIREGLVLTEGATTALSGINLLGSDVSYDTEETYPAVTMSLSSGAASLFSEGNKFVYNIVAPSAGSFGRTVNVYNDDGSSLPTQYGLDASQLSDKELTFSNFYLDSSNGKVYEGDVVLKLGTGMIGNASSLAEFEAQESPVITPSTSYEEAESSTKLSEVARFYNSEGIFLLEQPKTITITQGDGKTASITLYKTDTLEEVREKLNNAIGNGLGQLSYADRNKFVSYVEKGSETPQGDESVPGTFIIRSVIPGKDGELSFSGDDDLLNVLGLNTIQESEEFRLSASVYDAHSGKMISSNKKVTGNVIYDAVKGVDVELDVSSSGLKASWDENSKRFISQACWTEFIHLKDNGITFQTGANKGEDFSVQLGDMSSQALGISGVNATTREYASRSVGTIDRAINRVSSQRAKIGAYQNALEHTMENLTTTSMNLTSAESRIRDADMSKLMMKFVKLQILNQSGTSMLAQANQLPRSVLNLIQQ